MTWAWVALVWSGVILTAWDEPGSRVHRVGAWLLTVALAWAVLAVAALAVGSLRA